MPMTTQTVIGGRTYEFGLKDRLRIAREVAGLGQRELAERTGMSRGSIANYESGATVPRRPQLIAWAMATGFSLKWLESGEVDDSDPSGGGTRNRVDLGGTPTGQQVPLRLAQLVHLPPLGLVAAHSDLLRCSHLRRNPVTRAAHGLAA